MSRIKIRRSHESGLDKAREAADEIAGEMGERFGVTSNWQGDVLAFSHSAVRGQIQVSEEAIEVDAKLGLLVTPFKAALESRIHDYIDQYLA
ncbi:MAG: polyhydroxyalkanoic acid system family protein [Pseudomonadota bacterium]